MFPFQQGDELFQIPSTTHPDYNNINQQQNQYPPYHNNMHTTTTTTPADLPITETIGRTGRRRKSTVIIVSEQYVSSSVAAVAGDEHDDVIRNESDRRKEVHREIERHRRQEMSNLYSSLRSQLPVEYIKGKRSISDHMNEAVSYIKHLENKIRKMSLKRDELKRFETSRFPNESATNNSSLSNPSSSRLLSTFVQVSPCWGGVEIVITSGFRDHNIPDNPLPISNVLNTLQEDGFIDFGYVSAIVNQSVVYTIRAQVGEGTWLDIPVLREKLLSVLG